MFNNKQNLKGKYTTNQEFNKENIKIPKIIFLILNIFE